MHGNSPKRSDSAAVLRTGWTGVETSNMDDALHGLDYPSTMSCDLDCTVTKKRTTCLTCFPQKNILFADNGMNRNLRR